ncbi:MAG: OmpA family protein [Bacteroidota bacterium]
MRRTIYLLPTLLLALIFTACQNKEVERLQTELRLKDEQSKQLKEQLDHAQLTNAGLLDRMEDLSIISKEGATSIRESLESISDQTSFIQDMSREMQRKDSLNLALVMNLKRSLDNINDDDIQVEVRGGKVHVSISDQLLFNSASARVNAEAIEVLDKVALVLNDHRDLDVIVEGHTDNIPVNIKGVRDNWELSTLRATAVVRVLSDDFYVDPARLSAAGRAEFAPRGDNNTPAGRAMNRRTEIIITPKLDEFFKLLEQPANPG